MLESWKTLPLEDCMAAIIDYRGKSPEKTAFGVPLVTAKIVKGGRIEKPEEFIAEVDFGNWMRRGMPMPGDIVMTTEAPLGEVGQLDGRKVALAQRVITLRGRPDVLDNTFLKFLLQSNPVQEELRSRGTGTTVVGIRQSELRKVSLTLPPLAEQKAIAAVLGALDDKIELNSRMNATLEAMARALFQSWFVDFDPVRAKLDGHPPASLDQATADLFPDHIDHAGDMLLPKGWRPKAVYDCARFINGVAFRNVQFSTDGSGLPVVKIAELKNGISAQTKFTTDKLVPKYKIRDGEILFSWSGSPETSIDTFVWAGGDGWLNQHIFKVEFNQPAEKLFVYYLLKHLKPTFIEIARDKQTTGLGHVTAQDMKRLQVAFPTREILQAFQCTVQPIFERCFATLAESRTLATLRDTLLPKLLSGELSVKN